MPDIKMPDIKMPDIKMPDIKMPDIKMSDIKVRKYSGASERVPHLCPGGPSPPWTANSPPGAVNSPPWAVNSHPGVVNSPRWAATHVLLTPQTQARPIPPPCTVNSTPPGTSDLTHGTHATLPPCTRNPSLYSL
eukprot:1189847-Prorocentrum_minimum.AAC.1